MRTWIVLLTVVSAVVSTLAQTPTFEVVSVRASRATTSGGTRIWPGGRFTATNVTVRSLILMAYRWEITRSQLSGGPDWIDSERFDIDARAGAAVVPTGQITRATAEQMDAMLQRLLADRFQLTLRRETKEAAIYALTATKSGPSLKPSDASIDCSVVTPNAMPQCHVVRSGTRGVQGDRVDMNDLVLTFRQLLGQPVLDKTGVNGLFDVSVAWAPDSARSGVSRGDSSEPAGDPDAPDMFTAIQEQLGLKLESQRAPVTVLVIEHVERPGEN